MNESQFPILEVQERNAFANYRHMMFMLPILRNAKLIVETGLGDGHSTRIWLESLSQLKGTRYLITYEIDPKKEVVGEVQKLAHDFGIEYYCTVEKATEALNHSTLFMPIDILYLDSDHSYDNVYAELQAFKQYIYHHTVIVSDDAWAFGDGLKQLSKDGENPTDAARAVKDWIANQYDSGWKTLQFTETRGFYPENIGVHAPIIAIHE